MPAPDPSSDPTRARPSVLLAGATGLVGRELLRQLLCDPEVGEVRALVRRELSAEALLGTPVAAMPGVGKLRIGVVDYERLAAFPAAARCVVCQRQRETVYAHEATPRL